MIKILSKIVFNSSKTTDRCIIQFGARHSLIQILFRGKYGNVQVEDYWITNSRFAGDEKHDGEVNRREKKALFNESQGNSYSSLSYRYENNTIELELLGTIRKLGYKTFVDFFLRSIDLNCRSIQSLSFIRDDSIVSIEIIHNIIYQDLINSLDYHLIELAGNLQFCKNLFLLE